MEWFENMIDSYSELTKRNTSASSVPPRRVAIRSVVTVNLTTSIPIDRMSLEKDPWSAEGVCIPVLSSVQWTSRVTRANVEERTSVWLVASSIWQRSVRRKLEL